ncbi:ATP-grasp domain-containing protein [Cellulomonas bogoriensis]|uniref:Carboxylate--amine ligase n=1 Tax=Cellulomonas bogoriensis 69B4 = DSM 16987 TaxID=1386082 RepID=A0A0A0C1L1_9CELL|nr:ATP-grasp domain-containing protein [Cellulomonas bogoriensis]KGM13847.1 carboxylate--amine ligase [Cellulomonas bogoriensis 69B4 = DSM 16987]
MGEPPSVLVLGCASGTAHGRDQMRRLSAQARRRGLRVVGADTPTNLDRAGLRPGPAVGAVVDHVVALDVHDPHACRSWAQGRADLDAVTTFREMCVEPTAAVAHQLDLPGNTPDATRTIRSKDLCREHLRAAGFRQPALAVVTDLAGAERFVTAHGPGPWVVKPRDGMGSVGVTLVSAADELPGALDRLPGGGAFLVEEFVSGRELSAEGVVVGGEPVVLALTEKRTTAGFVEVGHRMPAQVDPTQADVASAHVVGAVRAVGLTRGVFHAELWLTGQGPVMGEVHARPGGDFLHAMVEHLHPGLELYGVVLDDLLGTQQGPVPTVSGAVRAAGAQYLTVPPGVVRAVTGWDGVTGDDAVLAADLAVGPGDLVGAVDGSADRPGVVVVGGATPADVDAHLTRLVGAVHVDVGPAGRG